MNKIKSKKSKVDRSIIVVKTDLTEALPTKKKRKKKTKSTSRMYFTVDTQKAIVKFNSLTDDHERNVLYEEQIKFPFEKLAENVMNTFKFSYFGVSPLDIQKEVVAFLVSNIHKFNPRKKTKSKNKNKAFSYFSVIAKHFLILYNNSNYTRWKRQDNIDDMPTDHTELRFNPKDEERIKQTREFIDLTISYWDKNMKNVFKKDRDLRIADAIIELFRRHSSIENFNKKALYLYIRDMTDCKTQNITKVINKMKCFQKDIEKQYRENGLVVN